MEKTTKIGYREVLGQKEYAKKLAANTINRLGDSIDVIAFQWLVYHITGSAAWSALIVAFNMLPSMLLEPFAGALVEGRKKKNILVITDCIRGAVTVSLAILYLLGQVRPWMLVVFTLTNSTVEAFSSPAGTALLPKILDEKYYEYGTSLNSVISNVMQLLGYGVAGMIIGGFGVWSAILIDAASFFGSALFQSAMKVDEGEVHQGRFSFEEYKQTFLAGLVYLKNTPVVRNFCIISCLLNAILVPFNSLVTPFVYEVLDGGSELISAISMSASIGMMAGAFLFPKFSDRFSVRFNVVVSGIMIGAANILYCTGGLFQEKRMAVYLVVMVLGIAMGMGASITCALLQVQLMKTVEQEYLARAAAIFNAGAAAASPLASVITSAAATRFGVSQIFIVSGALCVVSFLYISIRKVRLE